MKPSITRAPSNAHKSPTLPIKPQTVGYAQDAEIAKVSKREFVAPTTSIETDSRAVNRGHKKARG